LQRRSWACVLTAAAAVSTGFLGAFVDPPQPLFGESVIGHADWGILVFAAAFLAVGWVMVAVIRSIRAEAVARPGQRPAADPG
jgi:hypothetical protein